MTTHPTKGRHITGKERQKWRRRMANRYKHGSSIQQLANLTGRSYSFIRRLLMESGVTMRSPGGNQRWKTTAKRW